MKIFTTSVLLLALSSCAALTARLPPVSCEQCRDDYHLCLMEVHTGTAMAGLEAQVCMDNHEVCQSSCPHQDPEPQDPQSGEAPDNTI